MFPPLLILLFIMLTLKVLFLLLVLMAVQVVEKIDSGTAAPRSSIEAKIQHALETREGRLQETYLTWVKEHKEIKGNEAADKRSKQASILGHESEGIVTSADLKAWSRRVRAEARGGNGNGLLGWCREALSAYTWCRSDKRTAKWVAFQNWQGRFRQVQVRSST